MCNATGCSGPSDLCPVPQYLYANGVDGRVDVFPIDGGSGAPGPPVSTPGATNSLGMAALNNQFLYVSNPSLTLGETSTIDAWSIRFGNWCADPPPEEPHWK